MGVSGFSDYLRIYWKKIAVFMPQTAKQFHQRVTVKVSLRSFIGTFDLQLNIPIYWWAFPFLRTFE